MAKHSSIVLDFSLIGKVEQRALAVSHPNYKRLRRSEPKFERNYVTTCSPV